MRPSKTACRFIRLTRLVLLLLAGTHLPGATDDHGLRSGTYRGRILTEQFLHEQSVVRRSKAKAALSPRDRAILRPDAGNIAVIDTSGGVVIQPNSFDLRDLTLSFLPAAGGYTSTAAAASLNEQARENGTSLSLGDDDAQPVSLPFPFPYFDQNHSQAFVHSDGNLTFEESDTASTSRSLSRAASGPPRLAPLFSDLDPSRVGTPVSTYSSADQSATANSLSHGTPYPSSRPAPSALAKRFSSCSTGMERSIFTTA